MSAGGGSTKVVVIALFANLGIAVAKFFGAFVSKSAALLAEAIHSLVDCLNQVLLLVGSKKSKRPPSQLHPLGYGREAFFWSFIVAILLFSLGGLFAIYEGVHKLGEHEPISSPFLALGILIFGIILEAFSFAACLREVRAQNKYGSLWVWFRKTTAIELLVIFTEDAAAMLGLLIAATTLIISWLTGDPNWDAIGSILVGSVLVLVAVLLAVEIKSLLIGEAPATDFRNYVEESMKALIPGGRVFNLIALQIGSDEVMLSCKISAGTLREASKLLEAINELEGKIKGKFPEIKWLFIEPDTKD